MKAMTLRLDDKTAADLRVVAVVTGQKISEVVRLALADHLAALKKNPEFERRLHAHVERIMSQLDGEDPE